VIDLLWIVALMLRFVIFSKTKSLTGLIAAVMQTRLRLRWWPVSMANV